jgi:hypothetical protein
VSRQHPRQRRFLDLGFSCLIDGDHAPFILLVDETGQRHLLDLKNVTGVINPTLVETGREVIRGFKSGQLYGLVWDGYWTTDGVKQDAVFVEASAQGATEALVFAQVYRRKARSKELEKVGPPLVASSAPHQWT